jgi:hypothetical protein
MQEAVVAALHDNVRHGWQRWTGSCAGSCAVERPLQDHSKTTPRPHEDHTRTDDSLDARNDEAHLLPVEDLSRTTPRPLQDHSKTTLRPHEDHTRTDDALDARNDEAHLL